MKKIHLTPRAKKISVIAGATVVCLGVLSAVLFQNNASSKMNTSPASSAAITLVSSGTVSVNPITADSSASSDGGTFDPAKQKSASAPLTTASKPASAPPKPVVEGDSVNGSQPTNPALTDKSKKPTYTTKPKAPTSSTSTKTSSKSSGGSKDGGSHAGEFYDPVFGWTKSTGGQGTTVTGDWGGGEQIGSMD